MDSSFKKLLIQRSNELALRAEGLTGTNPMVGSLISRSEAILGEGWHEYFGGPHAEVNAIQAARKNHSLENALLTVSLEPCNHQGKTPSCSQAIIDNSINNIMVDHIDPNEKMRGESLKFLQQKGVSVTGPISSPSGTEVLAPFHINMLEKRPYIVIKMAISKDGFIGHRGKQMKISHPISDRWVHRLRHRLQAIMVGTTTLSNDNPSLTARYHNTQQPVRILLDRNGILEESLKVFHIEGRNVVFTASHRSYPNAEVIRIEDMTLSNIFQALYEINIGTVLVEGGASLVQSILDAGFWDELIMIRSQTISLKEGVKAPGFPSHPRSFQKKLGSDNWEIIKRENLR